MAFLGHVIRGYVISIDPEKIKSVQNWEQPKSVREIQGFLGLAGYY